MDYRNPNYSDIFLKRIDALRRIRANPSVLPKLKIHYKAHPVDFIADWGVTTDPRNIERGLPVAIPLVPWPRQVEWLEWVLSLWRTSQSGLTEKSRDMGCSVGAMSLFATLCLFNDGFTAGVGSRKEDLIDGVGNPNTLFHKARTFLDCVPREFRCGYSSRNKLHSSHMKIEIPGTGATLIGEAGSNIGRGGRAAIYLTDEDAFLAHPQAVDAALSQTTNCRIRLSSVNGMDNPFAVARHSGKVPVFTFHWRQDPRKDDAWYAKQVDALNPIIVAQEIDLDYSASKEGVLIPSAWVSAAIDAHKKLGIEITGQRRGALDVADEGFDLNAYAGVRGVLLEHLEAWSGKGGDIFNTVERAVMISDMLGVTELRYDGDGLGAGVRGDMRTVNARRVGDKLPSIEAVEFRGSGEVVDPDKFIIQGDDKRRGRTNKDFFANRKAQAWWHLRTLFQNTVRALEGKPYDKDNIISISSTLPELGKLQIELSQPTYSINTAGKIIIDKAPDGMRSPNHADAAMIVYAQDKKRKSILDF